MLGNYSHPVIKSGGGVGGGVDKGRQKEKRLEARLMIAMQRRLIS